MPSRKSTPEAFWKRVYRSGGPDACWPWLSSITVYGYGQYGWEGKNQRSRRIAWQLTNGPIPEGLCLCHHCDNRPCCNPAHLFLGTLADNVHDMHSKGRGLRGEGVGNSKLTAEVVRAIRRTNASEAELAWLFRTTRANVNYILSRKSWRHID
jgi:hypothetical protein